MCPIQALYCELIHRTPLEAICNNCPSRDARRISLRHKATGKMKVLMYSYDMLLTPLQVWGQDRLVDRHLA